MKILSDFDGVMTDQTEEGLHEQKLFRDKIVEASGAPVDTVDALIARAQTELAAWPTRHGWWSMDRVSAYADEDLFIRVIGQAVCMENWADQRLYGAHSVREGLRRSGFESFVRVSDWAYNALVEHTRAGGLQPMDPVVGTVLSDLLAKGHEIVVVSNSSTDRVVALLETLGLEPVRHDDDPNARFRVRGNARKFELGEEPEGFELDGFRFDVARPSYRTILEEERPQIVIGDVFSLDLALPLYLTRQDPDTFSGMQILLRTRHYTPDWSRQICTRTDEQNARLALLDDFAKLPSFVQLLQN